MSTVKLMDQMRQAWGRMNGAHVLAVLCALYETVIVTRLLLMPGIANPTLRSAMATSAWVMPSFVLIIVVAVIGIWLCRRWPLWMVVLETALFLLVSALYGSAFAYLSLPWAISLYFAAAGIGSLPLRICGLGVAGLLGLGSITLATVWHQDAGLANFLYPFVVLYVVFVAAGLIVRNYRERRQSECALQDAQERGEKLTVERDKAMKQSRIAAELHDSVGHDLTAIIALSEGLDGVSDQPEMNDAVAIINDLARQGLADTRTAVKALQPSMHSDGKKTTNLQNSNNPERNASVANEDMTQNRNVLSASSAHSELHDWDDINPILNHSRQIGIMTALTETGRRPQDSRQADLSFVITRESITNAIRHGQGINRIVASWDHDGQGGIAITVRDNGKSIVGPNRMNVAGKNSVASNRQKDKTNLADSEQDIGMYQPEFKLADNVTSKPAEYRDGTGLKRLKKSVEKVGGMFAAGSDTDGWTVKAYIPSLVDSAGRQAEGGEQA